jgi:hypothetical protein
MDASQLPNTLLYLASTSAQVWAALLIFYILLIRDQVKDNKERYQALWKFVNDQFINAYSTLASNMANQAPRYTPFGLELTDVTNAKSDSDCFERFVHKAFEGELILKEGSNFGLSSKAKYLHERLGSVSASLKHIKEFKADAAGGFKTGMAAIFINTITLAFHPLIAASACRATIIIVVIGALNLGLAFKLYQNVMQVLTWTNADDL